ncbi:hypothetical protein KR038_000082, partial [Drosophila bunnanda]
TTERGAAQRIKREIVKFMNDPPEGCYISYRDVDIFNWTAAIDGPDDTPYQGGVFYLKLTFGKDYPFIPPAVVFLTPVYHCNIALQGEICVDILDSLWSPAITVATLLVSIRSLMANPDADNPLVPEHAALYKKNREEYEARAFLWTHRSTIFPP